MRRFPQVSTIAMRRIIRKKQSGQLVGIFFFIVGLGTLFAVLVKAWPHVSSSNDFSSALWTYVSTEQVSLSSLGTLKLVHIGFAAAAFLCLGVAIMILSRQIFYVSGGSARLQCPYCKNSWSARRAVGWAECPFCRKFVQPLVMKKVA